jgi:alpha-galactosidase
MDKHTERERIKQLIAELEKEHSENKDLVRYEYIRRFGYYCTESSEHNAEYNNLFIKSAHPELIDRYNIPLDEYPRRCIRQIERWENDRAKYVADDVSHKRTGEYASYIMEAIVTGVPYRIGGNVLNTGLITNLPHNACVEVPCLVDHMGIHPTFVGDLPEICAAMNRTNVNVQLLTIEAARTRKREDVYKAALLDPHTSSELTIDETVALCDALFDAHGDWLPPYEK